MDYAKRLADWSEEHPVAHYTLVMAVAFVISLMLWFPTQ